MKDLKIRSVISFILMELLSMIVILNIYVSRNSSLETIIKDFQDKKIDFNIFLISLEPFLKNILILHIISFFFASLIVSFIKRKFEWKEAAIGAIFLNLLLSLPQLSTIIFHIQTIIILIIIALISILGSWIGSNLRGKKVPTE